MWALDPPLHMCRERLKKVKGDEIQISPCIYFGFVCGIMNPDGNCIVSETDVKVGGGSVSRIR